MIIYRFFIKEVEKSLNFSYEGPPIFDEKLKNLWIWVMRVIVDLRILSKKLKYVWICEVTITILPIFYEEPDINVSDRWFEKIIIDLKCHTRETMNLEMVAIVWPSFEEFSVVYPKNSPNNYHYYKTLDDNTV